MSKTHKFAVLLSTTAALALLAGGCKTAAPPPSGFLSTYNNLKPVDSATWSYVDASRLAAYRSFDVAPVKVLVKQYWGTTFNSGQQQEVGAQFRRKIVSVLSRHYELTGAPGPDTAEVRAAITQASRVGNALALGVEAEILDPKTHQQLAAIRGVRIGPPEVGMRLGPHAPDTGAYMAAWWTWPSAIQLMEQWADEIGKIVDQAHQK
jgi:Protein of unknown function (DUF3313)